MASINVFTDGSCINNGMANARGGVGIFFGVDHPRNISRGLGADETNNTAEVRAILAAVEELKAELTRGEEVVIHTDSTYAIKVCGNSENFAERMAKQDWKGRTGDPIPNAQLVKEAWVACKPWPNLRFVHVYGHQDDGSPETFGNNQADALAVAGAGGRLRRMGLPVPKEPAPRRPARAAAAPRAAASKQEGEVVWLAVGFAQKEQAKALGARWNPDARMWYVPGYVVGGRRAELVRRWGRKG
jgi:ribonuclease HI